MAFSRSHRKVGAEDESQESDRHAIVGLSGWLFADLLLAVAVIFLVATESPKPGNESEVVNSVAAEGAPTAALSFQPELPVSESGVPVWSEAEVSDNEIAEVGIRIVFSERVSGFGENLEDLAKDVILEALVDGAKREAGETGWSVAALKPTDPGREWLLTLSPAAGFKSSVMEVTLREGAVADEIGTPNPRPESLTFQVQRRPDTVINTEKASQIVVQVPGQACRGDAQQEFTRGLIREIENVDRFFIDVASGKPADRVEVKENFITWVLSGKGFGANPRIGFAFVYGPGDDGALIAGGWRECAIRAFVSLGWLPDDSLSISELPMKFFKDSEIVSGQLKIEMYFFSALGSSK